MRVQVRLFAALREAAGMACIELELPPQAQVRDVMDSLAQQYPGLRPRLGFVQVAVNRQCVSGQFELHDGDEVALLPPVGGG